MSREKELVKNTFIIGLGTLLPRFASFITLPIITGSLTKAELGTYDLISTMVSLFLPVVTLQLRAAAFRFLIDFRDDIKGSKRIISNIIAFTVLSSVFSLAILYCALNFLLPEIRILIVLYYFADIFLSTFQQIARGLSFNKVYSSTSLIHSISNMVLIVIFVASLKSGLAGALISATVSSFLGLCYVFLRCRLYNCFSVALFDRATLFSLVKYSWPLIPNSLSLWALSVSDRLVLTLFLGVEATAVYAVAYKIPFLLSTVNNTFVYAWQENAAIAVKDVDVDAYYSKLFYIIARLLAGGLGLIIGVTPFLFYFLIKGDYGDAFNQMPILFLAMFFSCISSFLGGIYIAQKKTANVGISTVVAAVINLAIDIIFVNFIGIYAASISTLISYLFLVIYRMTDIKKFQNIQYRVRELIFICACIIFLCIISSKTIDLRAVINLLVSCIFAISINRDTIKIVISKLKKRFTLH